MKTIILGDIHGNATAFYKVLEKVNLSIQEDYFILLGDLIDRGPNSYEVIQKVIQLKKEMKERMIILRGSHEFLFLDQKNKKNVILWHMVGASTTIRSFKNNQDDLFQYADWIYKNTVPYYEDCFFQCAHAGILKEPITNNSEYTLMMDHRITKKNQYKGKLTITGHIHLKQPSYFDGTGKGTKILPYGKWLTLPKSGVICIDTGCGSNTRCLTGMIIKDTKYYLISS